MAIVKATDGKYKYLSAKEVGVILIIASIVEGARAIAITRITN